MIQSFRLNVFLGVLACMLIFAVATRIMVRQVSEGPILLYLHETLGKHIDNEIEELKQAPQSKIDVASQVQIVQYNLGKSFADLKPNELQVWMAGAPSQGQNQLAALIENANWRDLSFAIEKPGMKLAEVNFQGENLVEFFAPPDCKKTCLLPSIKTCCFDLFQPSCAPGKPWCKTCGLC
jgi:hypothetical protein